MVIIVTKIHSLLYPETFYVLILFSFQDNKTVITNAVIDVTNISKCYCLLLHEAAVHLWQFDFYVPYINALVYLLIYCKKWEYRSCRDDTYGQNLPLTI